MEITKNNQYNSWDEFFKMIAELYNTKKDASLPEISPSIVIMRLENLNILSPHPYREIDRQKRIKKYKEEIKNK